MRLLKLDHLLSGFPLQMVILHSYVKLPEGIYLGIYLVSRRSVSNLTNYTLRVNLPDPTQITNIRTDGKSIV